MDNTALQSKTAQPINLAMIRALRGLSQAALAASLSRPCTGQYLSQIEIGTRRASSALLEDLARVLDVQPEALTAPQVKVYVSSPAGVVRVSA